MPEYTLLAYYGTAILFKKAEKKQFSLSSGIVRISYSIFIYLKETESDTKMFYQLP